MARPSFGLLRRKPAMLFSHAGLLRILVLIILVFFSTCCFSQNVIEYLPGFPGKLPFKLETGYIGVGEKEESQLFYYFFESESNPKEDPLLLWINGGPGCSSLTGIFYEIGPLTTDFRKWNDTLPALRVKEYSWTKVANIIFLDAPVGTGFSYGTTPEVYYTNDTSSAKLSYEFLRKWLISHPKYIDNPLYIGGDSYSGIPNPLLVDNVYKGIGAGTEPLMNMQGYVLGNPHTYAFGDINERVPYAYRMGLLSTGLYQSVKVNCHGNYLQVNSDNVLCQNDLERITECLSRLNIYMILEPPCDFVYKRKEDVLKSRVPPSEEIPTNFLQPVVARLTKKLCRNFDFVLAQEWTNNKSVRKALHIREGTKGKWVRCNHTIQDSIITPYVNAPYGGDVTNTIDYHKKFTRKNCRALIYSGDEDMAFPHSSTEKWIGSLKVPILSDWRPWFVDSQVAGYTMTYGQGDYELTYATVKGAGHTAPQYKPEECFGMISRWFKKSSL